MFGTPIYSRAFPPSAYVAPAARFYNLPPPPPPLLQPLPHQEIEYGQDFYATHRDVRKQLFVEDAATRSAIVGLRYPATPEAQRDVVNRYVQYHQIAKEEMLDFWMQYVDCLLCIPAFEDAYPAEFRAWAYGRLARYLLMHRQEATTSGAYDPMCNPVRRSDLVALATPAPPTLPQTPTATAFAASGQLPQWSMPTRR